MPTVLPLVLLCLASCCRAEEPGTVRLIDNMETAARYTPGQPELGHKWTGSVEVDRQDFKEGTGSLRFRVHSARSDAESYPQWGRAFDPAANDWTKYASLRYFVKVTSDDPTVTHKRMCVVVYNHTAPLQQFAIHTVPVGKWVRLTDDILNYNRDRVRGIIIYLYETNPDVRDDYTWWVDGLELVEIRAGMVPFDRLMVAPPTRPAGPPTRTVHTPQGLRLAFDERGRIAGMGGTRGAHPASAPASALSGLLIRDWQHGEQPLAVEGTLVTDGAAVTQTAEPLAGLQVRARYEPVGDRLRCRVTVTDRGSHDRPLTLYCALPVDAGGWTWWDDVRTPRTIQGLAEFFYNPSSLQSPRVSPYPFCCINSDRRALALATPLGLPRIQRMVYNPVLGLLYLAYDFCLTPAATKQSQTAGFECDVYEPDPRWGFRSAVDRYYGYFPEGFENRIPRYGGWGCWGTYEFNPRVPELGFQYHWGADARAGARTMANSVRFDNAAGYFALPYIEWTNLHVTMEGYEKAGNADIKERIRFIADPRRTTPLPPWSYWFPYDARLGPDRDAWMREVFRAYEKSLIYDRSGLLYGRADRGEFGILAAKYIPFNPDPDIPGGAGEFFLNRWLPAVEQYYAAEGVRIDGFGWDNFHVRGSSFGYRREHLAAADEPVLFDPETLQPVILKDMATYELQRELVKRLRAQGRYLIANQGVISAVPATLALLDIFGYEGNIKNAGTYARTMARHKPVCSLPCADEQYEDPFVRDHLLYGCWPGGYCDTSKPEYVALMRRYVPILRRLSAAGWEPVTLAHTDDVAVQLERFGSLADGDLLFSLKNHAPTARAVVVTLTAELPGGGAGELAARELVSGQSLAVTPGAAPGFALQLPAGQVVVVEVRRAAGG